MADECRTSDVFITVITDPAAFSSINSDVEVCPFEVLEDDDGALGGEDRFDTARSLALGVI